MLLLYILWGDWPIFMILGSNEQLQQELEYTRLKPDCHSWWIPKMKFGREDTLDERYAIKLCFRLGKNATKMYGIPQTAFRPSCMNRASVFEWHKKFKEGRESMIDDKSCGRSKGVKGPRLGLGLLCWGFNGVQEEIPWEEASTLQIGSVAFPPGQWPVHNSILVIGYLTKMSIKTVPYPPYSPDLAPCDFWLFPKLRGCHYEIIEEMKEAVTMVIDTLTQEGLSRSCWNGTTSALQPEEITSTGTRDSCVYCQ